MELTVHIIINPQTDNVRFVVVLAYLGAVVNEFICNQWEIKGMNTDVYVFG
jgi:hypothetical protein